MKAFVVLGAIITLFSSFSLQASTAWDRSGRYDDGFGAARFESQETHGFYREHGYTREDEGITRDSRDRYSRELFGYTWESTHDGRYEDR
ncbi:MAG: hypothetical protein AB7I18_01995 [Candidatus Berkiella sp.]